MILILKKFILYNMNVYTDGACLNNGFPNAIAGYGVYFSENDKRNEYARIIGKQSNNTGELTGFIRAVELTYDDILKKKTVNIFTDSEYVIKCIKSYGDKLAKNDWKTSTNKIPPNIELIQKAYTLYNNNKKYIIVHHIKAHTDNDDEHSIGNKGADALANLAVGVDVKEIISKTPQKYYLHIDYNNKDNAKSLGAKWDMNSKKWYYTDDTPDDKKQDLKNLETIIKNTPVEPEKEIKKNYVKIPFQSKTDAKKAGARWDAGVKSWYYTDELSADKIASIMKLV